MEHLYHLLGKQATGRLCRYGFPKATGKITNVRDAALGNVRVALEDGSTALMLYDNSMEVAS